MTFSSVRRIVPFFPLSWRNAFWRRKPRVSLHSDYCHDTKQSQNQKKGCFCTSIFLSSNVRLRSRFDSIMSRGDWRREWEFDCVEEHRSASPMETNVCGWRKSQVEIWLIHEVLENENNFFLRVKRVQYFTTGFWFWMTLVKMNEFILSERWNEQNSSNL